MHPKSNPALTVQWIDGETIVLHEENGQIHKLNSTAGEIFGLCNGENDESDIVRHLAALFDVSEEQLAGDVKKTLESFFEIGLLEVE